MDDCVSENDLIEYVRGVCSAGTRERVELHIDRCVACRRLVSELAAELTPELGVMPTQPDEPSSELVVPARVGRYVVLDRIGAGGMSVVYAAYDPKLDRKVALKLIRTTRTAADDDPDLLLREAQAQGRLAHPNVVAIHDVGISDGQVWLAMEFIAGPTARAWLRARPQRPREVLAMFRAAGEGLAAAHSAGLVHRDFKPDNVMIGEDGRARLMDFGLARGQAPGPADAAPEIDAVGSPWMTRLTRTGAVLGTPAYMAPEQWRGEPVDARSDQFAYCVALWEALCGERPFAGDDAAILAAHVMAGRRRRTRAVGPAWLRRALERGLAVDPARRWPTMRALLDALDVGLVRRRVTIGGALLCGTLALAWGSVAGLARWDAAKRTQACATLAAEVSALWDAEAEAGIREAFAATKVAYAATTADRVIAAIDAFTAAWSTARGEACVRRDRDPEWTRATAEQAEACLLAARWSLQDLLANLHAADGTTVQLATAAALGLTPPARCLDVQWLAARPQAPPDGPLREPSEDVRRRLVRAGSLYAAGRYGESLALAKDLTGAADELGWAPLAARTRIALGVASKALGDAPAAERALEDGFFLALGGGDPASATLAASKLASTVAFDLHRPAEGIRWGRWGEALLARSGAEDVWSAAVLLDNLGAAHLAAEDYETAQALFERAVAAAEASLGPDHPDVANAHTNLGRALTARGATEPALREHERAVAIATVALGAEHPDLALFLDGLAGALANAGEQAAALGVYRRALAIAERTGDDGLIAILTSNTGWTLRSLGRIAEARALHEQALAAISRRSGPGHPDVAKEWNHIGDCHFSEGANEPAAEAYTRALTILEAELGPAHSEVALTRMRLGYVARARGDLDASLAALDAARASLEATLGANHPDVAVAYQGVGETQLARGRHDEAEQAYRRGLAIWEAVVGTDSPNTAYALLGLGQVALARGRASEAATSLQRVRDLCTAGDCPVDVVAAAEFGLARAIVVREPARARELAAEAEARLVAGHLTGTPEFAAIRRWRGEHP